MRTGDPRTASLDALQRDVRRLFFKLRAAGDLLHADRGVTSSMRAVLERLSDGPRTVPDMARAGPVSRQHIQLLVNALLARAYVAHRPNPDHRRSSLIALTIEGRAVFGEMRKREFEILKGIAGGYAPEDLAAAGRVLQRLVASFDDVARDLVPTEPVRRKRRTG